LRRPELSTIKGSSAPRRRRRRRRRIRRRRRRRFCQGYHGKNPQ